MYEIFDSNGNVLNGIFYSEEVVPVINSDIYDSYANNEVKKK